MGLEYDTIRIMRPLRNFKTNQCCHLVSRIANRAFFLNDEEKTRFVERLWRVATFSCLEVLAYCFMSNHFHILVYVPDPRDLSDEELLSALLQIVENGQTPRRPTLIQRGVLGCPAAGWAPRRYQTA